ncbi:MAG: thioredoxin family protein [Gemmatimonadetes bacterium]|jgi:small redox-active disulfide protein 2|nr:thioredoxin family protein [Gemmatimonadota bacterium]MBT6146699.1 thioredoxin family protein [Gemmatimonadota bacterium]MBT7864210.1 thioredoxin family protein [Gemmatimonadota bacterium]
MKIQVLGTGCPKCEKLEQVADQAARELDLDYEQEKVTDINEITGFGVMMTPALVVDGQVKVSGSVPSLDDLKAMLK